MSEPSAAELVALDLPDVRWIREGMVLTLRSSKTDQEGQGTEVAVPKTSSTDGLIQNHWDGTFRAVKKNVATLEVNCAANDFQN